MLFPSYYPISILQVRLKKSTRSLELMCLFIDIGVLFRFEKYWCGLLFLQSSSSLSSGCVIDTSRAFPDYELEVGPG